MRIANMITNVAAVFAFWFVMAGCTRQPAEVVINEVGQLYEDKIKLFEQEAIKSGYVKFANLPYRDEVSEKRLILYSLSEGDCHACSARIAGILVSKPLNKSIIDGTWKVDLSSNKICNSGSWGKPGNANIVKLGKSKYALAFYEGYSNMGETAELIDMYSIEPKEIKKILRLQTYYSFAGQSEADANSNKHVNILYSTVNDNQKEYYDIKAKSIGTDCTFDPILEALDMGQMFKNDCSKPVIIKYEKGKYQ
jgi:hypothetical protein